MAEKILVCNNLIGDSLYLLRPIDLYLKRFPGDCKGLSVLPGLGGDIVRAHFEGKLPIYSQEEAYAIPGVEYLPLEAGRAMDVASKLFQKSKKIMHISEAYAYMLGVNCNGDIKPPLEWVPKFDIEKKEKGKIAVLGPFSRSCSRHSGKEANKTIDDWKWEYLIRYLRKHDYQVLVTSSEEEYLKFVSLPVSSYRSATTLDDMLRLLSLAELVICVDSGTGHIASACGTPTIILWSGYHAMPPQFIAPLWAEKTSYLMMGNPNTVSSATLLYGLKKLIGQFEEQEIMK